MGRAYWFICPRCGYKAAVAGGEDRGHLCFTVTIECVDCKQLYDVPTRVRVNRPEPRRQFGQSWWASGEPWNRTGTRHVERFGPGEQLFVGWMKKTAWQELPVRCPASRFHRIKRWTRTDKCPRCGVFLEQNVFPYRLWE